jgi:hypothetical protein
VASVVSNYINAHLGQVLVYGANDIEPGFGTYPPVASWIAGFSTKSYDYYDYGSADGCPQTTHSNGACNNGWNQYDEWYASWGATRADSTPEIYYQSQSSQWEQINLYGSIYQSSAITFTAPWDEYDLDTGTFTAQQAWNSFTAATGEDMQFDMEIHDE